MTYSNPRREAILLDWPFGSLRTTASFEVEMHPERGERTGCIIVNPKNGRINKPKYTTYSMRQLVVDGDDGCTYVAELGRYGMILIRESNLQDQKEVAHRGSERFDELLELFA